MEKQETPKDHQILLTPKQAAEELSISERQLWAHTSPRGAIPCVRIGGSVRYSVKALKEYANQQQ